MLQCKNMFFFNVLNSVQQISYGSSDFVKYIKTICNKLNEEKKY